MTAGSRNRSFPFAEGSVDPARLFLNTGNQEFALRVSIPLPAPYRYEEYRLRWHAGFQSDQDWPLIASRKLDYRRNNGGRDARTNWELNRHYQFALLAKDYLASDGREWFLQELTTLFDDWNDRNPFLMGISWTDPAEIAIRLLNWCLTLGFLSASRDVPADLKRRLEEGILRMAGYLYRRPTRFRRGKQPFVEASALLHAGILTGNTSWTDRAITVLDRELHRSFHADGVSRGGSSRDQAIWMEACAFDLRLLKKNGIAAETTEQWIPLMVRMARVVRDHIGVYGEMVTYGDSDDGKLIDLTGGDKARNYYRYVLELMSLLLPERYLSLSEESDEQWSENTCWFFTREERSAVTDKPLYDPKGSVDHKEGGRAILRSTDQAVLIGLNHAAPGYGAHTIHGHADSLSFQVFVDGLPLVCDPGTYLYHTNTQLRNAYRGTAWHSTVSIDGRSQSGTPGKFRWEKRAVCRLLRSELGETEDVIEAEHDGYRPVKHRRKFIFDRVNKVLTIEDHLTNTEDAVFTLVFSEDIAPMERPGSKGMSWRLDDVFTGRLLGNVEFLEGFSGKPQCVRREISRRYGFRTETSALTVKISADPAMAVIRFDCSESEPPETP